MSEGFDWEFIKAAHGQVRLGLLNVEPTKIRDDLYKLGPQEYLIVNSFQSPLNEPSRKYFGILFFWAPSVGTGFGAGAAGGSSSGK